MKTKKKKKQFVIRAFENGDTRCEGDVLWEGKQKNMSNSATGRQTTT